MKRAAIAGSGMAVPEEILDNKFFEKNGPYRIYGGEDKQGNPIWKKDEWEQEIWLPVSSDEIVKLTGIKERRALSGNQTIVDLSLEAAEDVLHNTKISSKDLDAIICSCVTMPRDFPSMACHIQSRLNAKNVKYAVDISAGCAGSVHGLDLGAKLIRGGYKKVLIIGAEGLTLRTDYTDRNCILFGDGAGALILTQALSSEGILATDFLSNSCEGEMGWLFADKKGCVRMPYGKKVMKLGIRNMIKSTLIAKIKAARKAGVTLEELNKKIKYYFPHQANIRMLNGMAAELKTDNIYRNIEKYGNMSSATWIIALHEALRKDEVKKGDFIAITAFGSGLATGAAIAQM